MEDHSSYEKAMDCTHEALPDACGNDLRQEKLLERQSQGLVYRERNLLVAAAILAVAMNISTGRYLLYPFMIFSTWIHEMCHGMAAVLSGGYIAKLQIFKNGSGLAYTASSHRGFVASAGYPGTAVTGCLLLLFRRTTLGPTIGTIGLGSAMLISCALYVRDSFGAIVLPVEAVFLILCAWKLPAAWLDILYNFLATVCCLNAIENMQDLYASSQGYAGDKLMNSDAHTVAALWGGDYRLWATIWLLMALLLTVVGIFGARNARPLPFSKNSNNEKSNSAIPYVSAAPINEATSQVVLQFQPPSFAAHVV